MNKKRSKKNKKKVWPWITVIIVVLAAVVGGLIAAKVTANKDKNYVPQSQPGAEQDQSDWGNRLQYKGKNYRRNENIKTILFLGIDRDSAVEVQSGEEAGHIGTGGRSDAIILFLVNDEAQTTTMLSISRDTMTEVDVYDMKGNYAYSGEMQINMQHAFGDSPSKSLNLTKRTVSELLYGIRIDGALSLTMDGIQTIVDKLNGITLTMPEDYSYIDERYTEGATVKLDGKEMEHFIRYRDTNEVGSNEERARRQSWLIGAVFQDLKAKGAMTFLQDIVDSDPDYLETDCDAELLKKMSKYPISETKYKVPGSVKEGERHDEFYVDEEVLQDLIVELLYVPAD